MPLPPPAGNFKKISLIAAFSLVEVMAVIAIMAILTTLSFSNIGGLAFNANAGIYATSLSNALSEAKAVAMQRRRYVTVCPVATTTVSATASVTIPACVAGTTAWNSWVVYIDSALNPGTTTELISLAGNIKAGSVTATVAGSLIFNSFGLVTIAGSASNTQINFIVSPTGCSGKNARQITLRSNGTMISNEISC
jgi:prepilin-type N-terminal cleavage/methylation domain-containing protein